jgi:hypothetical protein
MKSVTHNQNNSKWQSCLLLLLAFCVIEANYAFAAIQKQDKATKKAIIDFHNRVQQYLQMREQLAGQLPKLTPESNPEEIESYFVALQERLCTARTEAKQGEFFTPTLTAHLRRVIQDEFEGKRLERLRAKIREADTKGVPIRVNVPYSEMKELVEMPPTLLLRFPALPKQLRFHFVGRALVLLDKEARIILDYLPNALP